MEGWFKNEEIDILLTMLFTTPQSVLLYQIMWDFLHCYLFFATYPTTVGRHDHRGHDLPYLEMCMTQPIKSLLCDWWIGWRLLKRNPETAYQIIAIIKQLLWWQQCYWHLYRLNRTFLPPISISHIWTGFGRICVNFSGSRNLHLIFLILAYRTVVSAGFNNINPWPWHSWCMAEYYWSDIIPSMGKLECMPDAWGLMLFHNGKTSWVLVIYKIP